MSSLAVQHIGTLALAGETWSTPALVDSSAGLLVVAADRSGVLSAFDGSSHRLVWKRSLGEVITASPICADLDGDGEPELLIGTHRGELFALRSADGSEIWRHIAPGPIRAPVAVADLNQNGKLEVILASYGPEICVLSASGDVVWRRKRPKHAFMGGTKLGLVGAPLVYDVDRDGKPEIVLVGRSPWVICYSADGHYKWYKTLKYDSDSSPSFAVVDGKPLVLIGGGEHTAGRGDNALIALDGRTGKEIWRVQAGGAIDSSPTISRLPSGRVVAFVTTLASHKVMAVDVSTGRAIWSHRFGPSRDCDHSTHEAGQPLGDEQCRRNVATPYFTEFAKCRSYTTPLVADLDGDGRYEVAAGSNNGNFVVLDAESGAVRHQEGTDGAVRGSIVMADIDRDGKAEMLVPSGNSVRIYRVDGDPPAVCHFKGRSDMLGADFEDQLHCPSSPHSFWPTAHAGLLLTARDAARWVAIQVDKRTRRILGRSFFEYYY